MKRYYFEGEDDEEYKVHTSKEVKIDIVQEEINKKEQFLAQLTPYDDKSEMNEYAMENEKEFLDLPSRRCRD